MQVISVANQKGGVGKTTTTVNLATAFAAVGYKVLLLDFDPQGNASTGLGISDRDNLSGSYSFIADKGARKYKYNTCVPNLQIMPANTELSGLDQEYAHVERKQFLLQDVLNRLKLDYDYILIDCPPALGLLTINALVASHAILIPLQCEYYALEGLSQLVKTVSRVQFSLNPYLDILGIVLTMYDPRSTLCDQVVNDVKKHFGEKVYRTLIPRSVKVSEAPSHGQPVMIYDVKSIGSIAYMNLATEIIRQGGVDDIAA